MNFEDICEPFIEVESHELSFTFSLKKTPSDVFFGEVQDCHDTEVDKPVALNIHYKQEG